MASRTATADWLSRCAQRIAEVEPDIDGDEAVYLARQIAEVERLSAMPPEAAVDFVAEQLKDPASARFERRAVPR